jgi:hypothetical protein
MATFYRTLQDLNSGFCYLYTFIPGQGENLQRIAPESSGSGVLVSGVVMFVSWDVDDLVVYACQPSADKDTAPAAAEEVYRFTQAHLADYYDFSDLGSTGDFFAFYGEDTNAGVVERTYYFVAADGALRQYRVKQQGVDLTPEDLSFTHQPNAMVRYADGTTRLVHAEDFA